MTETVMLILTAVNVAAVVYALVIDRAEKAASRTREWRACYFQLKEEVRAAAIHKRLDTLSPALAG